MSLQVTFRPCVRLVSSHQLVRGFTRQSLGQRTIMMSRQEVNKGTWSTWTPEPTKSRSPFSIIPIVGLGVTAIGGGFLFFNWETVRSHVSHQSADLISETIDDEKLHDNAMEFSTALLQLLLADEHVKETVAAWARVVLASVDLGDLVVSVLQNKEVVGTIREKTSELIAYLCRSQYIQQNVGDLLVKAIFLEVSRNSAAENVCYLLKREDVKEGLRDVFVLTLQNEWFIKETEALAIKTINDMLTDPRTQSEIKKVLNEALGDTEVRDTARDALWDTLWPSKQKTLPKISKDIDEILDFDALSEEECQVLRALQSRMRADVNATRSFAWLASYFAS